MPPKKKIKKKTKIMVGSVMYLLLFAGAKEQIGGADKDNKCGGEERWDVKVLTDTGVSGIIETPLKRTIEDLTAIDTKLPANKYAEGKPRMDIENQVYTVRHCFITDVLRENDNDLHFVIEDGKKHTMIAEMPDPKCSEVKKSQWISSISDVRNTFLTKYKSTYRHYMFTLIGVLFVDKAHGQTGKAPNSVELHPILELKEEKTIIP